MLAHGGGGGGGGGGSPSSSSAAKYPPSPLTTAENVKRVYLVRHGESRYNSWRRDSLVPWRWPPCSGLCIGDPLIMDAALSPEGERQLEGLSRRVQELGLDEIAELVVTSPLTRAIQTTLGGFDAARLAERGVDIVASALHVEVCDTACDIGRPLAELREEFPQLQWGASVGADGSPLCRHKAEPEPEPEPEHEPEHEPASPGGDALAASLGSWWYGGEGNPARRSDIEENPWSSGSWSCRRVSCCPCSSMVQREPWEEADARVLRFKQWLDARPESCIVVVGHSSFFQRTIELLADKKMPKLANCEVLDCEVRARCMHLATWLQPTVTVTPCGSRRTVALTACVCMLRADRRSAFRKLHRESAYGGWSSAVILLLCLCCRAGLGCSSLSRWRQWLSPRARRRTHACRQQLVMVSAGKQTRVQLLQVLSHQS